MQASTLRLAGASIALVALAAACSDSATNSSDVTPAPRLASLTAQAGELYVCKFTVLVDDISLPSGSNLDNANSTTGSFTASLVSGGGALTPAFANGGTVALSYPSDNNCAKVWSGSEAAVVSITETPTAGSGLAFYRIATNENGGDVISFDVPGIKTTPTTVEVPVSGTLAKDVWFKNMPVTPSGGCTYTLGYWKTHSTYGPAPKADPNWASVGGPDATFFTSNQTWYQVFNTAPKGNAYYILAHQYMAAVLNKNAGASTTSAVDAAMTWAFDSFTAHPLPTDAFWTTNKVTATGYASTLDGYNNGLTGPGHCGDEATK